MKKTVPELDKLFEEVGTYKNSVDYLELLNFVRKFPQTAPYNAMLVHVQKPGSEFVASAREWLTQYGRRPKAGARPLVILRPFGPVSFVFELNDTEGKPFPKALLEPFKADGVIFIGVVERLRKNMLFEGISSTEQDYGTAQAGFIEGREATVKLQIQNENLSLRILFNMVINSNMDPTSQLATIFHELGHVYCGHFQYPKAKWLPDRDSLSVVEMEFEAESVCWLVCERMGIKNPSAEYLSGYLKSNDEIPHISIDTVLKAAGTVESIMAGTKAPRKELLIKK